MTLSIRDIAKSEIATPRTAEPGEVIRQAREALGYSLDDLAETCGLTIPEIIRIEVGADRDLRRLRRVAAPLQVDLSPLDT
ncbi:helix-turn-helix domain-containing protein [Pararhizobium sp. O133]|uniref:helix-turn-helix domain-containing protein n=1 Tax=Pararhizobium sp. O133 TaxID=3449278 RepID=UPI003F682D14